MIRVIFGEKGAGKTKRILDMANNAIESARGNIVFIDADKKYMFDVKRSIRFINASDYHIDGPKMFYGFLNGIAAQDFDLEKVYIDSFHKIVHHPLNTLEGLFEDLEAFAKEREIDIFLSVSGKAGDVPEFLKSYLM